MNKVAIIIRNTTISKFELFFSQNRVSEMLFQGTTCPNGQIDNVSRMSCLDCMFLFLQMQDKIVFFVTSLVITHLEVSLYSIQEVY